LVEPLPAEPLLAEPGREAGFDAAALRERLAVLLPLLAPDRFVVAMSPSQLRDPRILRSVPAARAVLTPCLSANDSG
jgi:hypothetical protein